MKMATLEEEKARRTAIQFCVLTFMTSNDSLKHLKKKTKKKKKQTYTVVFRGALFFNGMVDFRWVNRNYIAWTETIHDCP